MPGRQLDPEERALWARVAETVRALHPRAAALPRPPAAAPPPATTARPPAPAAASAGPRARPGPGSTLDGGWDRRLGRGAVAPDRVIDLHGYNLSRAHAAIEDGLADALARGDRLVLVVTGRPPRDDRPGGRGAIRAALGDWLAASRHGSRIAAVRPAHPRHGGAGALYLVLRREK